MVHFSFLSRLLLFWGPCHISGLAIDKELAWIGWSEFPNHRHLSSCKHCSRDREPDRYCHCHVICFQSFSFSFFQSRLESNITHSSRFVDPSFLFLSALVEPVCFGRVVLKDEAEGLVAFDMVSLFSRELSLGLWTAQSSQTEELRIPPADYSFCSCT